RRTHFLRNHSSLRSISKSFSCGTLSVPNCHATRKNHEGWDVARLLKPRQMKRRVRGRVQTTDLPITLKAIRTDWGKYRSAVAPFRRLTAMPLIGGTRAGIVSGCPSLERGSREVEVGFEP
ncbi:hypothetical protein T265_12682, partial [Opisthorchis viverrini]